MHQETTMKFHENVSMTTESLIQNRRFDRQSTVSSKQTQNITKEEQQTKSSIRAKSADDSRTMVSSSKIRSTAIYIDELDGIKKEDEKRGLTILNNHFADYLNKIKSLGDMNIHLRRQINDTCQKYMGYEEREEHRDNKTSSSSEIDFSILRRQLNIEIRRLIFVQIRLQRANYDKKFYKNKFTIFSTSDQNQRIKHQLDANLYELDLVKEQYDKQKQALQSYKKQYHEYMTKLIEYTNEYNHITCERMQSENSLYTLKEQFSFEREYTKRCEQEFEYLEKVQCDSNNQFNKTEFENIIKKIRQDYQKYNEIQLSELEILYKIKLDSIENHFYSDKKENHSEELQELNKQNRSLQLKFKQLDNDLYHIKEQNRQQYEIFDDEYKQLENQLPELESLVRYSRDNTVHLSSAINTYQCLLINLVSPSQEKPKSSPSAKQTAGFILHFEDGVIWIRI